MSFDDERHEPAEHRPALCFRCRRCRATIVEPVADAEVEIRRRIETGQTFTMHTCAPAFGGKLGAGALGLCELIGEAERLSKAELWSTTT